MNLHQLRYLGEIVRCRLNISRAATALGTSQPALSQQVRLLEEELGVAIFVRSRNRLAGLTTEGQVVVEAAQQVLADIANLQSVSQKFSRPGAAEIKVVSSHAQARYALPAVIQRFHARHPGLKVRITHRQDERLWQLVQDGLVDLAITTETDGLPKGLLTLPCYEMRRSLIAPRGHVLLRARAVTLAAIAQHPLIAHDERSNGHRRLMRAFNALGFTPKVLVSAMDEDVIKACVAANLGVAILASIVYDARRDAELGAADVTSLLTPSVTSVIVRRNMAGHDHIAAFIEAFAPEWTKGRVAQKAG